MSLKNYLNHSFFNTIDKKIKFTNFTYFNFLCLKHEIINDSYCKECKQNICDKCINEHSNHQVISFTNIGLSDIEKNEVNKSIIIFENNINNMNKNIQNFVNKLKSLKGNELIYKNDNLNNYKKYYIDYINTLSQNMQITKFIELIDFSQIICEYNPKRLNK